MQLYQGNNDFPSQKIAVDIEVLQHTSAYSKGMHCDCNSTRSYRCPKHFAREVHLDVLLNGDENAERFDALWRDDVRAKFSNPSILNYTVDETSAVRRRYKLSLVSKRPSNTLMNIYLTSAHRELLKPKEVRKFKGEGMLLHFSSKKGDLYVTFEVLFPTSLAEGQKSKIKVVLI